jgi:hypothetical protein
MFERLLAAALALFATAGAHAHGGHGAIGEWHWHATDTAGFVLVAVLGAVALWLSRGE